MKEGINKVILLGNVGLDPELKFGANGSAVLRLRLATSDRWKDKQSGEQKEATEWHTVVFFGPRAEGLAKHITKGSGAYIEGSLRTRSWEKDGVKRYTTEVIGREFRFLGGGQRDGGQQQSKPAEQPADGGDFGDDDIPFRQVDGRVH